MKFQKGELKEDNLATSPYLNALLLHQFRILKGSSFPDVSKASNKWFPIYFGDYVKNMKDKGSTVYQPVLFPGAGASSGITSALWSNQSPDLDKLVDLLFPKPKSFSLVATIMGNSNVKFQVWQPIAEDSANFVPLAHTITMQYKDEIIIPKIDKNTARLAPRDFVEEVPLKDLAKNEYRSESGLSFAFFNTVHGSWYYDGNRSSKPKMYQMKTNIIRTETAAVTNRSWDYLITNWSKYKHLNEQGAYANNYLTTPFLPYEKAKKITKSEDDYWKQRYGGQ